MANNQEMQKKRKKKGNVDKLHQQSFTTRLQLNGKSIDVVEKIKILGVTVTNKLDWS